MGHVFVKQPDGLYAIFSTIVDDFICIDATQDELIEEIVDFEMERARENAPWIAKRVIERLDAEQKSNDPGKNFYECVSTVAMRNPQSKLLEILAERFNLKPRTTNDS